MATVELEEVEGYFASRKKRAWQMDKVQPLPRVTSSRGSHIDITYRNNFATGIKLESSDQCSFREQLIHILSQCRTVS